MVDNDCSGAADDADSDLEWCPDGDVDLFGDHDASPTMSCARPFPGWVSNCVDCNDERADIRPGGLEVINDLDDDCDGVVDERARIVRHGGIHTLGGAVSSGDVRIRRSRLETFSRACRGELCITGGIAP